MLDPNLIPNLQIDDYFACGENSFKLLAAQAGVITPGVQFEYNGWMFKLDKTMPSNQVAGIGPRCSVAAKNIAKLMEADNL